jgi:hypothetical protein
MESSSGKIEVYLSEEGKVQFHKSDRESVKHRVPRPAKADRTPEQVAADCARMAALREKKRAKRTAPAVPAATPEFTLV